jgi:anti-sigma B factor antagonist
MKTANGQLLEVRSLPTGRGTVIVAVTGVLDLASAPVLERELQHLNEAGARRIVIDATDLSVIDETGISVLVMAHRALVDRGGDLEVYNAGAGVEAPLDASGLRRHVRTTSLPGQDDTGPD